MNSKIKLRKHTVVGVIILRNHTALLTHMYAIFIRYIVQPFATEPADAVGKHNVALHLTNTEPAVAAPSFRRLPGQVDHGADRATVLLIIHHVFQSLIENGADENIGGKLFAGKPVVQNVVSVTFVPEVLELLGDGFHVEVAEAGSVTE